MFRKVESKVIPFLQDTGYGFSICGMFSLDAFKSALGYKPQPDDLFIVAYPRSGSTWVQNIVTCIYKEGRPYTSGLEFYSNNPYLEMTGAKAAETMKRPGVIKFHLPFHLTPWSQQAKYIFVARNPKDCVVSYYHHVKNSVGYKFQDGQFDDFFELFMEGKMSFGDYFDTLPSWYSHRNDPNVLFITYEQLKEDTRTYILKIAEFMGQKYKDMLTNDESILKNVIKHSSFDFMKANLNPQVAEMAGMPPDTVWNHPDIPPGLKKFIADGFFGTDPNNITVVRKGIVGDFKNYLSAEQNLRLEEKLRERMKGTDILKFWEGII